MKRFSLAVISLLFIFNVSAFARSMHTGSDFLAASEILQAVKNEGYQQVREMEYEHGIWKIEALDSNQQEVDIRIEPTTGKFIPHHVWSINITMLDAAKKVEKKGNNIREIELKRAGYYKVKLFNQTGHHTLYVNAKTGKISRRR